MVKRLTVKDLPKDALVAIVEATGLPMDEKHIADVIIRYRMHRAGKHAEKYDEIMAAIKPIKGRQRRRELEIEAQRHAVNMETLFDSSRKLAEQYGLLDKYFEGFGK